MEETLIECAARLARSAHGKQRYGNHPYELHLAAVVAVLERFGVSDPALLAAGWLHDVVEDTGVGLDELRARFKTYDRDAVERMLGAVDACTDGPGVSRAERKARPYRLLPITPGALLVKLADRIANVESCVAGDHSDKLAMYLREYGEFSSKLRAHGGAIEAAMWKRLDELLAPDDDPRARS